jgi:hypothetical protein
MLYPILLFPLLATTKASYYKTLRISKLQKMDRSHSKLVSFLLSVTFTALDKHTACTNMIAYYRIRTF